MPRYDYLYVISAAGKCKIGCAQLPRERFSCLQNGSPVPLTFEYVCEFTCSARPIEQQAHAALAAQHSHREWFTITPAQAVALLRKTIAAAGFAPAPVASDYQGRGAPRKIKPKIVETTAGPGPHSPGPLAFGTRWPNHKRNPTPTQRQQLPKRKQV